MSPSCVYVIERAADAVRCVRVLLSGGVDPNAVRIHGRERIIAVRVLDEVPEPVVSKLTQLGYRTEDGVAD